MAPRESIYAALFARLSGLAGFKTTSRRSRQPKDVTAAEQPALFLEQVPENIGHREGFPPVVTLNALIGIYARTDGAKTVPGSVLNPLIDAVLAALEPEECEESLTLGGLVRSCLLGGDIDVEEGIITGQGIVVIPVVINVNL